MRWGLVLGTAFWSGFAMRQTGLPFDTHGLARQISQVLSLAGLSMTPRDAQLIDRGLPF